MSQTDDRDSSQAPTNGIQIDYPALARFLLEPLVDEPEDLSISYETTAHGMRVWLRVSLGKSERGRTFGRGGRNIRAVRTILRAAGQNAGQSVFLEVIGEDKVVGRPGRPRKGGKPIPQGSKPKPKPKLKPKD